MSILSYTVSGKPMPKQRPRLSQYGKAYTPKATREYERKVAIIAKDAVLSAGEWDTNLEYSVAITASFADRRHGDIDNILKAVLDAMNGIVYNDDKQVRAMSISRLYGNQPELSVMICSHQD